MNFFWSYQQLSAYELIKYGYLYNWYAATSPQTVEYGYLYNGYAAKDIRNITSSDSWVLPMMSDWDVLISYLGGSTVAGGKVKATGTNYWFSPNTGATNEVGFNARGAGERQSSSSWSFSAQKTICRFMTKNSSSLSQIPQVIFNAATFNKATYLNNDKDGWPVRLVKTTTTLLHGQTGIYTGNDGRIYSTICIGTQEWLSENLMETKYRNGDAIPEVTDNTAWSLLTTGARCSYNNTQTNVGVGSRITSSDDWVLPTYTQLETLQTYLGGSSVAGGKMKEAGTTYWNSPNTGADNSSLFNGRGSGWRTATGDFSFINDRMYILSETYAFDSGGLQFHKYFLLKYDSASIFDGAAFGINPKIGGSLRLLYTGVGTPTSYTGNDGKVYRVVTIGTQTWLADNLAETKYRDGSTIPVVTDNTAWSNLTTGARCVYNNDENNR